MSIPQPQLYIIAGPNGVGKTTYVKRFLPERVRCLEFINADMIAQGLAPFAPDKASVRAGRIMLERLDELVQKQESFSFETTLSGRGYVAFLRQCRAAGYRIHLDFLWVPALALTSARVRELVSKGGHDIPGAVQERRFFAGLRNLFALYRPLLDHWRLFDNSFPAPLCVAEERDGQLLVHVKETFDAVRAVL
jgi:predicted ABC-type ATPase